MSSYFKINKINDTGKQLKAPEKMAPGLSVVGVPSGSTLRAGTGTWGESALDSVQREPTRQPLHSRHILGNGDTQQVGDNKEITTSPDSV